MVERKDNMANTNLWYMVNVVYYDGSDAFVSKFVVQAEWACETIGGPIYPSITKDSERRIRSYLDGNGEVLKIDPLYPLEFDNILALKDDTDRPEHQAAYGRFVEMWF